MKLKYAVIYERTPNNYSAYSPDLPGCISTGKTWQEIQKNIREAITTHIESLMEYGDFDPQPQMSTKEAMIFHRKALTECDDPIPQLETIVGITKVEVKRPRIIIDASYIRGMKQDGAPLRAISKQGGRIVVTETLVRELITSDRNRWPEEKQKLVACRDAIELWKHVSELYRFELKENRPCGDPLHIEGTERLRSNLANNPRDEPGNLEEVRKELKELKKHESRIIPKLFEGLAKLDRDIDGKIRSQIKNKAPHDNEVVQTCYNVINDPDTIRSTIGVIINEVGNEVDVTLNPQNADKTWAIWHFSKSLLTVFCDSLRRGEDTFRKPSEKQKERLYNKIYDLDYLILLAFADAIASRETKGELFYYRRWMFGDRSKSLIRSYEKEQIVHTFRQMSRITVYVAKQLDGYTCALDPWSQVALKVEDSRKLPKSIFISYGTEQHFDSVHGPAWEQTVKILTGYSATELQEFGRVVFVDSRTMKILPDPSA